MKAVNERVHFRLLFMSCCGHLYCRVNPRLPNFCPECGARVYAQIKAHPEAVQVEDTNAILRYTPS